jgi:mRNA interferase MazF
MTCRPGELVAIPFPYSDLSASKRRPVLVLTFPDRHGDFIGLAVTSVRAEESAIAVDDGCMVSGHIPKTSWVRCDKVFTLSGTSIVKSYGMLKRDVMDRVMAVVCDHLNCKRPG